MSSDERSADGLVQTARSLELTGVPRPDDLVGPDVDGTRAVIDQADALMRRHRVYVAGTDRPVHAIGFSEVAALADDLPVLTEVVEGPVLGSKMSATDLALIRERQQATISTEVGKWAEAELTTSINALVGDLTEKLVATLTASAKTELLERLMKELDASRQR